MIVYFSDNFSYAIRQRFGVMPVYTVNYVFITEQLTCVFINPGYLVYYGIYIIALCQYRVT